MRLCLPDFKVLYNFDSRVLKGFLEFNPNSVIIYKTKLTQSEVAPSTKRNIPVDKSVLFGDILLANYLFFSFAGIPTASYLPALKRFPTTPDYVNINEINFEPPNNQLTNCTDMKNMWQPCMCHLEQCIGWYPCDLKYCKAKNGGSNYRCGIKTCKICHLFVYYISQKQQCLWDE